jgi:hypothetical protein
MRDGSGQQRRQQGLLVVILPGALESESKATLQEIRVSGSIIVYPNGRSLLSAKDLRVLAFLCIKIEVSFHTAGKHIEFRLAGCPKRPQ